jgi:hypothetical protein
MAIIVDGTGAGNSLAISSENRMLGWVIQQRIETERAEAGKLFGIGTGSLALPASFSGPVLWFQNDESVENFYVTRLIFGWNGGDTNRNRTLFSLIYYRTTVPTAANTATSFANENIAKFNVSANAAAHKWDNATGTAGMTGSTGGAAQIPNRLAVGNTSLDIHGNIILGPGQSMQFDFTPDEAGDAQISVVGYWKNPGADKI